MSIPMSFKPTPFYFLNDEFNEKEVVFQLNAMAKNGVESFFLHVRDGIVNQAYGTDVFFSNVKFIVDYAASLGLKVWLYDEDSYPSGNVGGKLVLDKPELQARSLICEKIPLDENGFARKNLGRVSGLYGYVILDGEVKRLDNCFGPVRERWYRRDMDKAYYTDMGDLKHQHVRAATCYTDIMFELKAPKNAEVYAVYLKPVFTDNRYGTQSDCLSKKTTDYFIKHVHEKYFEYVGEYFGSVIQGVFLDEPALGGVMPYTDELESYFSHKFHYSAKDNYYKLCTDYLGETASFRRDYVQAISELFCKNFLKPLHSWCNRRGLKLMGHFNGEEDLLAQAFGCNVYKGLKYLDIQGFDIIGNNLGDMAHPALILGSKISASVANQLDKTTVLAESFALNPFNFGYKGLKVMSDWLFVNGINWIVPHAFFYGYSAMQRSDAGKGFFIQDPLFNEYLEYSKYAERVCDLLNNFKTYNDVLVVLPYSACSEEVPFPITNTGLKPRRRALEIKDRLLTLTRLLCQNHVTFDVSDTHTALKAKAKNGKLVIDKREYSKVIVVSGGDIELSVYNRLNGLGLDCSLFVTENDMPVFSQKITREVGDVKNLQYFEKSSPNGRLVYIYNNSYDFVKFSLCDGKNGVVFNAEKNEYLSFDKPTFALNGFESVILIYGDYSVNSEYVLPREEKCVLEYKSSPQWVYMPEGAKYAITKYDLNLTVDGKAKEYKDVGLVRIRDVLGTYDEIYKSNYVIPYFDTAPRPKSPYPVHAEFVAKIRCAGKGILLDKLSLSGDYKIYFNNKLIKKEEITKQRVYDVSNVVFYPKWKDGENELKIVFENAMEFDGVNGEIYVI